MKGVISVNGALCAVIEKGSVKYKDMKMNDAKTARIWEIDFIRGIALSLMIIFHFLFDLNEFYGYPVQYNSGVYFYIGKVSAILFIIMSAVSSSFSRNNARRAVKILAAAGVITAVSHLYDPKFGIKFGILHFLGISILLYPLFRGLNKYILLLLGTTIILLGQYLDQVNINSNYLFLFNLTTDEWVSADYYPLFPWFGVFLYGIVLARLFYYRKRSLFGFDVGTNLFSFIGRNTLPIYLFHQPVLLLLIGTYIKLIT